MAIHNGIGITAYRRNQPGAVHGTPAAIDLPKCFTALNPIPAQVNNVAISGFGADTDSITLTIVEPDGTTHTFTVTRAAGVPADDAAAAVALAALVNASAALLGVVVASTSTTNLILSFSHRGISYEVTTAVTGCTATVTQTSDPAGVTVPLGRFVTAGAAVGGVPTIAIPTAAAATALRGILLREPVSVPNLASRLQAALDELPAGDLASIAYDGLVNMENVGAAANRGDPVFVVVATTGGDAIGEARGSASGATPLFTCTPTAVNDTDYGLEIVFRGVPYTEHVRSDASATATEICDLFRTAFGTIAGLTFGGTATLTITGSAGEDLTVRDLGPGVMGVVATTAVALYAVQLPRERAYWADSVANRAVGPIMLRM